MFKAGIELKVRAKSIGRLFLEGSNHNFFIKHVFNHTVYLKEETTGNMYLVSSYPWRSPYTINIPPTPQPLSALVKPLAEAELKEKILFLQPNLEIILEEANLYDGLGLGCGSKRFSEKDLLRLATAFNILSSLWRDLDSRPEYKRVCRVMAEPPILKEENILALVGLGGGFTPSGDDFLTGYIGALVFNAIRCGGKTGLPLINPVVLDRTTWASRNYLVYSMNGIYDELAERALYSLFSGDFDEAINTLIGYSRRGHESGLYIWLGLITGYIDLLYKSPSLSYKMFCQHNVRRGRADG